MIEDIPIPGGMRKPRKSGPKPSPALRRAAQEYKREYLTTYGMRPTLTFDGTYVRIEGQSAGISLRRLKELTTQLRNRRG